MASKTSIANGALVKLGQDLITSITDTNNKAARICNERIDNAKEVVLNTSYFHGSIKRVTLAALTTTPAFKYSNEFQIPSDCLKIVTVEPEFKDTDYALEGGKILFDGNTLEVIYVSNITDFNLLDPLVNEAISAYLAHDIAYLITNDNQTVARMEEVYNKTLQKAISSNNRQRRQQGFEATDFLNARLIGGYPASYPKPTV
jgi:hypothetical protein